MSQEWVASLAWGLGGAGFLQVFFWTVRLKWPTSYYSVDDLVAQAVSKSAWRYLLFRLAPLLLVTTFVTTATLRAGFGVARGGLVVGLVHFALTSGRAMVVDLRRRTFARQLATLYHIGVGLGVAVTAFAGSTLSSIPAVRALIPTIETLPESLWTALLAGISGAFFVQAARKEVVAPVDLVMESRRTISDELWNEAKSQAEINGADVHLLHSVMLVENLQRPAWIRKLELIKGRLVKGGSYGIMQVHSAAGLSDSESVVAAAKKLASFTIGKHDEQRDRDLRLALSSYNDDRNFVNLATELYGELAGDGVENESASKFDWEDLSYSAGPAAIAGVISGLIVGAVVATVTVKTIETRGR